MKVEISKINIKIGDKEVELSLAEARELRDILTETLKPEQISQPQIIERIIERPYTPYPWRGPYVYWSTGTLTYGNQPATTMTITANAAASYSNTYTLKDGEPQ